MIARAIELCAPLIKWFEGCHKKRSDGLIYPYACPAGLPTQGWGVVVGDLTAPPITQEQADAWFLRILPDYLSAALQASPGLIAHPHALAAMTSFVFNLGPGRYRASTLRRRINAGDWAGAEVELLKWTRGGGRVLPGLVKRRAAEAAMLGRETGSTLVSH